MYSSQEMKYKLSSFFLLELQYFWRIFIVSPFNNMTQDKELNLDLQEISFT